MTLYRGMDRAALDAAYNNSAAVADSPKIVADWEARSARLRAAHPEGMGLRYGPDERNRIDYFSARRDAPVLVFIHGGYWQNRAKEVFSFVAEGPLAWGINVALVGYTLAPQKRLDGIVAEIRAALSWLGESAPMLGHRKIYVSGWSAGGHLTAMTVDHPAAAGGLAISGIFDLEPIRRCYLNDVLGMDEAEARRNSPLHLPLGRPCPVVVAVGALETQAFHDQSRGYAARLEGAGWPCTLMTEPDLDHFAIVMSLADPGAPIVRAIARQMELAQPQLDGDPELVD